MPRTEEARKALRQDSSDRAKFRRVWVVALRDKLTVWDLSWRSKYGRHYSSGFIAVASCTGRSDCLGRSRAHS